MNVGAAWHAARAENETTRRDDSNPLVAAGLAIFVGVSGKDYAVFLDAVGIAPGAFTGTGNESSATCGRLSFLLGATGASAAVDTACSSSLVAACMATGAVRRGDAERRARGVRRRRESRAHARHARHPRRRGDALALGAV